MCCILSSMESMGRSKRNPFPSDVHIILIGFDGWGSHSLEKADMPIIRDMMKQGSWTLKKRSVLPSSSSPNWASMFMGASPEIHGYTLWNSMKPEIPSVVIGDHNMFPTIFQLLRQQRRDAEIGVFFNWSIIKYLVDSLSVDKLVCFPVHNQKDKYSGMTKLVADYILDNKPELCTVVYDFPDHYGHASGFDSKEYYQSLQNLDRCLESIVKAAKDAGIYDKTIFVVTSDHGGIAKEHGGKSLKEMESPFLIFGCNVKKNNEIKEMMLQYDIAATIAYILGLETPQAWIGRPVFSVFEKKRK